jgi:rhamnosyltransferase
MSVMPTAARRLGIYSFYDPQGIVDRYVVHFLRALMPHLDELAIVVNGLVLVEEKAKLLALTPQVLVRENSGFDIWGYKTGLDHYGWARLEAFDEVIVCNNTVFGPVYPFERTFTAMDGRDLDFWGLTRHYRHEKDPTDSSPLGYTSEHIQSYFMAFRQSFVQAPAFQAYWDQLPPLASYHEAIGKHETFFTHYFSGLGFRWDTSVDSSSLAALNPNPILYYHQRMIKDHGCPVIKRRSFFQDYDDILFHTTGQPAFELYAYIRDHTGYDIDLIWENLLRTCHHADLADNLHLNYILPSGLADPARTDAILRMRRIALVMHLYFPDLLTEMADYARSMPATADIYISTNTIEKKAAIEAAFATVECGRLEVRVLENRGRDVSSLLVGMRDVIPHYDYVCFVHDKKSGQVKPGSIGESFAYKCLHNMLHNQTYVENILATFENEPRLGLLVPPEPNHSYYFFSLGDEWSWNYDNSRILAERLGLTAPMAENKRVVAPLGSYFWFRSAALAAHFANEMDYADFPEEPLPEDGSISHALERIYPFVAQQAGFYPAVVMADELARLEHTNLRHYVSQYNQSAFEYSIRGPFTLMNAVINQKMYDAPKWVGIAGERLELLENMSREFTRLQTLYEGTYDVRFRLWVRKWLPGWLRRRHHSDLT